MIKKANIDMGNIFFSKTELSTESFKELLPIFFEEIFEDYSILKDEFVRGNLSEVRRFSHKIKGTASSYSAILLFSAAIELQKSLDSKRIDNLEAQIEYVGDVLNQTYDFAKENIL